MIRLNEKRSFWESLTWRRLQRKYQGYTFKSEASETLNLNLDVIIHYNCM
jgi:hypothetical protein